MDRRQILEELFLSDQKLELSHVFSFTSQHLHSNPASKDIMILSSSNLTSFFYCCISFVCSRYCFTKFIKVSKHFFRKLFFGWILQCFQQHYFSYSESDINFYFKEQALIKSFGLHWAVKEKALQSWHQYISSNLDSLPWFFHCVPEQEPVQGTPPSTPEISTANLKYIPQW